MRIALTLAAVLISCLVIFAAADESPLAPALGLFVTAGLSPKALTEKKGEFLDKAKKIIDRAYDEDRELTEAENAQCESLFADIDECDKALGDKYAAAVQAANRDGHYAAHARRADLSRLAGSAAPDRPGGNRRPAGTVMFQDQRTGEDIRAYAHNEPLAQEPVSIGRLLYARLTGNLDSLNEREFEILNMGSHDSGGGYLLTPAAGSAVIDLARSASVVMQAGRENRSHDHGRNAPGPRQQRPHQPLAPRRRAGDRDGHGLQPLDAHG
jgi:hypothetical protein